MFSIVNNIGWIICNGLFLWSAWNIIGIFCLLTIIEAPYAHAAFRLARYAWLPFRLELTFHSQCHKSAGMRASRFRQTVWLLCFGVWLAVLHLTLGLVECATLIGIPWGIIQFKLALACFNPCGSNVISALHSLAAFKRDQPAGNDYSNYPSVPVRPTGRIFAIPMLGANQHMFLKPWREIPGFCPISFQCLSGEEPFPEMARILCSRYHIHDGDALIGVCLGGMIGLEISHIRKISALFVISSASRPADVYRLYLALVPLLDFVSNEAATFLTKIFPFIPAGFQRIVALTRIPFVKEVCSRFQGWMGCEAGNRTRIYRIHGDRDFLIPIPRQCDLVLAGGHLIAMTHARQCADFVKSHFLTLLALTGESAAGCSGRSSLSPANQVPMRDVRSRRQFRISL